jgi:hypothetical protein
MLKLMAIILYFPLDTKTELYRIFQPILHSNGEGIERKIILKHFNHRVLDKCQIRGKICK